MKKHIPFLEKVMNPIEYKRFGDTLRYYFEDNKNQIKNHVNSFKEEVYTFLQKPTEAGNWIILCGVFAGVLDVIFSETLAGNFMKNLTMSVYQTKADQDIRKRLRIK